MSQELKTVERNYYRLHEAPQYLQAHGFSCNEADLLHLGILGKLEFISNKPQENAFNAAFNETLVTHSRLKSNEPTNLKKKQRLVKIEDLETEILNRAFEYSIVNFEYFSLTQEDILRLDLYGVTGVSVTGQIYNQYGAPINPKHRTERLANGTEWRNFFPEPFFTFIFDMDFKANTNTDEGREALSKITALFDLTRDNLFITTSELKRLSNNIKMDNKQAERVQGLPWSDAKIARAYERYRTRKSRGESIETIATEYGITRQAFSTRMKRYEQQNRFKIG